ncbi:hypothetical protein PVAND_017365 [Polypedilum vanderplanki]|uniref:C2H2-type domain-containing protein n=1 Tax=Polypedilum vanderplanki TaxID=319348 RepID=A0A9J6BJ97_POLVA|nr:hypothetical protein PVAND_017365 [Polypedilum vanderplanki]
MNSNFEVKVDKERNFLGIIDSINEVRSKIESKNEKEKNSKSKWPCKFCNAKLSSKKCLQKHLVAKHQKESKIKFYSCDFCREYFFIKTKLTKHFKTRHKNGKIDEFICDFDGKIFLTRKELSNHIKCHKAMKKCEICEKEVKDLRNHMRQVHSSNNEKFECVICLKNFKKQVSLKNHLQTHKKNFQCQICGRKFSRVCDLKEHMRFHDGAFRCEICFKKFGQKGHLKTHSKIHDKNRSKPHKCHHCDYSTDRKHRLTSHLKIHDENREKGLKCNQCDYKTDNKYILKVHLQIHNPNRIKFPCLYCNYEATERGNLKEHLKRKHNPN